MNIAPLLTIAIPTRNRALYLRENLIQLKKELSNIHDEVVELIVSDNCSTDETEEVVKSFVGNEFNILYVRNEQDIGWGRNFLQCFNLARGTYVLILGDDDFFVDGALPLLLNRLQAGEYGVLCFRPYGFDFDFRDEFPGLGGGEKEYSNGGRFIEDIGALMTLISCCIINKKLISDPRNQNEEVNSKNLPVLHLVLRAALSAKRNLYIRRYLIACKRNNSSNYIFSEIFVNEMWNVIRSFELNGLDTPSLRVLERRLLVSYYPFYILQSRLSGGNNLRVDRNNFDKMFGRNSLYYFWLRPIFLLPKYPAIIYGALIVFVGRAIDGDLLRGVGFAAFRVKKVFLKKLNRETSVREI
jgi:abequosyltransferase